MFQHILILVDTTDGTKVALDYGIPLARRTGAQVHLAAVVAIPTVSSSIDEIKEIEEEGRTSLAPALRAARAFAEEHGQPVTSELLAGPPGETIVRLVATRGIDLVVVGQYGEALDSEYRHVVRKAPCPVFVAREAMLAKFSGPPGQRTERWEVRDEHRQRIEGRGRMLRVFVGEADEQGGRPLFEVIVQRLRELDVAGATVYRGLLGFGAGGRLHGRGHLPWSHDAPVIVTAVDTDAVIQRAIAGIQDLVASGLIVCSEVEVIKYAHVPGSAQLPDVPRRIDDRRM